MTFHQHSSHLVWWSGMISMPSDQTNTSTSCSIHYFTSSSLLSFILRSSAFQLLTVKSHTKWNDYENTHYNQQAQNTIKYVITKIQWSWHCFRPYLDHTYSTLMKGNIFPLTKLEGGITKMSVWNDLWPWEHVSHQFWSYLVWWSEMISMPSDWTNTSTPLHHPPWVFLNHS